jgi:hypothetical protein
MVVVEGVILADLADEILNLITSSHQEGLFQLEVLLFDVFNVLGKRYLKLTRFGN